MPPGPLDSSLRADRAGADARVNDESILRHRSNMIPLLFSVVSFLDNRAHSLQWGRRLEAQ